MMACVPRRHKMRLQKCLRHSKLRCPFLPGFFDTASPGLLPDRRSGCLFPRKIHGMNFPILRGACARASRSGRLIRNDLREIPQHEIPGFTWSLNLLNFFWIAGVAITGVDFVGFSLDHLLAGNGISARRLNHRRFI